MKRKVRKEGEIWTKMGWRRFKSWMLIQYLVDKFARIKESFFWGWIWAWHSALLELVPAQDLLTLPANTTSLSLHDFAEGLSSTAHAHERISICWTAPLAVIHSTTVTSVTSVKSSALVQIRTWFHFCYLKSNLKHSCEHVKNDKLMF